MKAGWSQCTLHTLHWIDGINLVTMKLAFCDNIHDGFSFTHSSCLTTSTYRYRCSDFIFLASFHLHLPFTILQFSSMLEMNSNRKGFILICSLISSALPLWAHTTHIFRLYSLHKFSDYSTYRQLTIEPLPYVAVFADDDIHCAHLTIQWERTQFFLPHLSLAFLTTNSPA